MSNIMTTKVFTSGNSQAVRIPRQFRLEDGEVYISKDEEKIVIYPKPKKFASLEEVSAFFESIHYPDFEIERDMSLPRPIDL
jgi:antitoxin VapB